MTETKQRVRSRQRRCSGRPARPLRPPRPRPLGAARLLAALLLIVLVAGTACGSTSPATTGSSSSPATSAGSPSGSQGTSVTDITVPPPNSPNVPIYQALGWDHVYVLYFLKIEDGWAYVHGIPFTSTEGPTLDTRALLRQDASGTWQVLEKSTNQGLLTDVGQAAEDQDVPAQFRRAHPDSPDGIFPVVRPGDKAVLDAVRTALGSDAYRFNTFLLNIGQDWAYSELRALTYNAGTIAESRDLRVLLRRANGSWTVQQLEDIGTSSQADFVSRLKASYPDVPAGILP